MYSILYIYITLHTILHYITYSIILIYVICTIYIFYIAYEILITNIIVYNTYIICTYTAQL